MKATVVDLRYRMKEVLKALDKKERVTVLYHGKVKGTIIPINRQTGKKVQAHPFFGMLTKDATTVQEEMRALRGGRNDAL